jgi:hypothetical protein
VPSNQPCPEDVATGDVCTQDLMYSADFGHSWTNLTQVSDKRIAGFVDFDWAPPIDSEMDDGKPGILATVGLYKLNPIDPMLESAWFQHLNP